jgi:hypothetical protein
VETCLLKPLKTNTIGAKDVEKISKKCVVTRIHGRNLPADEQFLLFEMRRLLLDDVDYEWDSSTGQCALQTVYTFSGERGMERGGGLSRGERNRRACLGCVTWVPLGREDDPTGVGGEGRKMLRWAAGGSGPWRPFRTKRPKASHRPKDAPTNGQIHAEASIISFYFANKWSGD